MARLSIPIRDLSRKQNELRDRKLIFLACDDTYAPKQYFNFFELDRVRVINIDRDGTNSSPKHVLDSAIHFRENNINNIDEDDEIWIVLDIDHNLTGNHKRNFIEVLEEAKNRGFFIAVSNSCFETWLILHFASRDDLVDISNAKKTEIALKALLSHRA